jgi:O-acetylserine/cysteine efflux transporter
LLGSILAYTLWTRLLKRHSANRVAPFSLGVPVIGLAAGMLMLSEQVSRWQWAGIVFVIAALVASFGFSAKKALLHRPANDNRHG